MQKTLLKCTDLLPFYRISSVCLALHAGAPRASLVRHLGPSWARLGLPKPSQDSSKIPKIAFWKRLGRVLDRLGAVLERLAGISRRLGAYSVHLGALFGRLGAILARLGAILGRLGRVLASRKPPEIAPRRLQDASQDEVQHRAQLGLSWRRLETRK